MRGITFSSSFGWLYFASVLSILVLDVVVVGDDGDGDLAFGWCAMVYTLRVL